MMGKKAAGDADASTPIPLGDSNRVKKDEGEESYSDSYINISDKLSSDDAVSVNDVNFILEELINRADKK